MRQLNGTIYVQNKSDNISQTKILFLCQDAEITTRKEQQEEAPATKACKACRVEAPGKRQAIARKVADNGHNRKGKAAISRLTGIQVWTERKDKLKIKHCAVLPLAGHFHFC